MHDRRLFLMAAAGTVTGSLLTPQALGAERSDGASDERGLVFVMNVLSGPAWQVGAVSDGVLSVVPLNGGSVEGPRVKGTLLPGGLSWVRARPDGSVEYSVRSLIRAENGQLIAAEALGLVSAPKKGAVRRPSQAVHRFQVASGPYEWLNNTTFFGIVTLQQGGQRVQVYEAGPNSA